MRLSQLQAKDVVNTIDGKKIGHIVDIIVDPMTGAFQSMIVEEGRGIFHNNQETEVTFEQIVKMGEDVILIKI